MSGSEIKVRAPAKINLYLEVGGRRADGYHDLRSVVVPISLCDDVTLRATDGEIRTEMRYVDSSLNGVDFPSSSNMATRAAELLKEHTLHRGGVVITIDKAIPLGGGLGGGSSDAAAVLRGLNQLWQTGLSRQDLMTLGFTLGCDVPALVHGGPVCMEGAGEAVSSIQVKNSNPDNWWVVVGNPCFSVLTQDIYERYRDALTPENGTYNNVRLGLEEGVRDSVMQGLFNSLQSTAFRKFSLLELIKESLHQAGGAGAMLSGSGGSLFAFAESRSHAEQISTDVAADFGGAIWCCAARMMTDCPMV